MNATRCCGTNASVESASLDVPRRLYKGVVDSSEEANFSIVPWTRCQSRPRTIRIIRTATVLGDRELVRTTASPTRPPTDSPRRCFFPSEHAQGSCELVVYFWAHSAPASDALSFFTGALARREGFPWFVGSSLEHGISNHAELRRFMLAKPGTTIDGYLLCQVGTALSF